MYLLYLGSYEIYIIGKCMSEREREREIQKKGGQEVKEKRANEDEIACSGYLSIKF